MGKGTTFREEEIALMNELFTVLNRGGDPSVIRRSAVYASVMRKFQALKTRVEDPCPKN